MEQSEVSFPTFAQQLRWLMTWAEQLGGRALTLREIAQGAGLSVQALQNLLSATTPDPRFNTVRGLCQFFQVSLDYFGCSTEAEAQAYLAQRALTVGPLTLQSIAHQSQTLNPRAQENVLLILRWIEASHPS
jgi:transcriptional regulator with XRE-family HTH domain